MFTVMFAMGRLPGWIAQWKEMIEDPSLKIGRLDRSILVLRKLLTTKQKKANTSLGQGKPCPDLSSP